MNIEIKKILDSIGFKILDEKKFQNHEFYYIKLFVKNYTFIYTVDKFHTHGYFLSNGKERFYDIQHKFELKDHTDDNIKIVINDLKKIFPHKFRKSKTDSLLQ